MELELTNYNDTDNIGRFVISVAPSKNHDFFRIGSRFYDDGSKDKEPLGNNWYGHREVRERLSRFPDIKLVRPSQMDNDEYLYNEYDVFLLYRYDFEPDETTSRKIDKIYTVGMHFFTAIRDVDFSKM